MTIKKGEEAKLYYEIKLIDGSTTHMSVNLGKAPKDFDYFELANSFNKKAIIDRAFLTGLAVQMM